MKSLMILFINIHIVFLIRKTKLYLFLLLNIKQSSFYFAILKGNIPTKLIWKYYPLLGFNTQTMIHSEKKYP